LKVTFLGTGTSAGVPMVACNCEVCLSKDPKDKRLRSSVLIQMKDNFTFVIDTTPDFRYQMLRANVQKLDAILFTHDHKDHTGGLDDIRPFNYKQGSALNIYATETVQESLKMAYAYIFSNDKYPGVPEINMETIVNQPFKINNQSIVPIEVLHYNLPVFGFRINDFTYITDANYISESELAKAEGTKVLVLNALRIEKHISHFTLEEAIEIALKINAEKTYFTHISHQLGKQNDISMNLPANIHLAYDELVLEI